MYKVSEIADILNVSKVAIYKKINKQLTNQLTNHIKLVNGVKFITNEGLEIIKTSISVNQSDNQVKNNNDLNGSNIEDIEDLTKLNGLQNDYINSLKEQIEHLKEQLETKDKQLENKDELLKNFQVLLKHQEQIQGEHNELLEYIAISKEEERKGFWRNLFKK